MWEMGSLARQAKKTDHKVKRADTEFGRFLETKGNQHRCRTWRCGRRCSQKLGRGQIVESLLGHDQEFKNALAAGTWHSQDSVILHFFALQFHSLKTGLKLGQGVDLPSGDFFPQN